MRKERERLLDLISTLPRHEPRPLTHHIGYHSPIHTPDSSTDPEAQIIEIKYPWSPEAASIALVPALHPDGSGFVTYGFPRRFRIEVQDKWYNEFQAVVDWTEKDFPDPGPYPVFFDDIDQDVHALRLIVPPQMQNSGATFFAMGEVFLFHKTPISDQGANMALWSDASHSASDSLSVRSQWNLQYLFDGYGGLGPPLSDEVVASEDFFVSSDEDSKLSESVSFTFDLGEPRKIGRVDVWPAKPPFGVAVTPFGFPGTVIVERSDDPDFTNGAEMLAEASGGNQISGSVLKFFARNEESRYIRVTVSDLEVQDGYRVLGLGEISITAYNRVHPITEEIKMNGIPDQFRIQLPRLTDGFSQERRILSQADRIKGLAQRRPLDRRLEETVALLEAAEVSWNRTKRGLVIASIAALIVFSLIVFYLQNQRRRESINAMRKQITRDLHDEVGSSMGSIWLSAERMEKLVDDSETRKELSDLSLMAREASASLLEVVWESDQSELHFNALVQKLIQRAERVLQGREIVVDISETLPGCLVSLGAKRHIDMFFKEAIHNCARHSHASRILIRVEEENNEVVFHIEDNGCGFEAGKPSSGWGLINLRNRAEELGGSANIDSVIGEGTTIILRVPVTSLLDDPKRAYRTSN